MNIKNIFVLLSLTISINTLTQSPSLTLPSELTALFKQAAACAQTKESCAHIVFCNTQLAEEKALTQNDLIAALEQVHTIAQTQELAGLEEASKKLIVCLEAILDELLKDADFAKDVESFNFQEEDDQDDQDEMVTRGKKKNKTFKNLCVQRNVSIGGNLCVAGKALFKNGIAFGNTESLTITAPLNVTTVQGQNATFTSGSVGTVNIGKVFGLNQVSSQPSGTYSVYYNPTTGILYFVKP